MLQVLTEDEVRAYEPATRGNAKPGYEVWRSAVLGLGVNQGVLMSMKDWRAMGYKTDFGVAVGGLAYGMGRKYTVYKTKTKKSWVAVRLK